MTTRITTEMLPSVPTLRSRCRATPSPALTFPGLIQEQGDTILHRSNFGVEVIDAEKDLLESSPHEEKAGRTQQ
jgi:hypothetical protein